LRAACGTQQSADTSLDVLFDTSSLDERLTGSGNFFTCARILAQRGR
jgi:hypothetical protein